LSSAWVFRLTVENSMASTANVVTAFLISILPFRIERAG
jgi:hypothetical protein